MKKFPYRCDLCGRFLTATNSLRGKYDICLDCERDAEIATQRTVNDQIEACDHVFVENEVGEIECEYCGVSQESWKKNKPR